MSRAEQVEKLVEEAEWLLTIASPPLIRDMTESDWKIRVGDWFNDLYRWKKFDVG